MKFKSVLLILIVAVLAISMVSCGQGQDSTPEPEVAPEQDVAEEPEATEEPDNVELVLWAAEPANEFGAYWGDLFEEKYPYIQITTNVMGGDPGNEYFAGVARGDAPDLVAVSLAKFDTYVNAGIVQDITALGEWDDLANFDQGFLDSLRRDGDLYAVPNRSFPMLFGYNKALFAEAGLDGPPQTWEEVLEYAALITNADEDISGYCMLSREWTEWWFQYYVWQAGGDLTVKNADGTIELTFTDPAVITAAEFYQTLLKDGLVQSDLSLDFGSLVSRFAAGKCGMMPFASDWVNWAVGEGIRREDIGLSIFPAGPSGNQSAAISGSVWVINPAISDAKKAAAMEYIKFYTSHDYMAAFFGEMAGSGAMNPEPMVRTDLSLDEFGLPEEYAAVLAEALVTNRPEEFYGKGDFGTYVDYAIQQIIQDPTMDPAEAFAEAQALAISDGKVDDFNAQFGVAPEPEATEEPENVELVLWAAEPANEFGAYWGDLFEEKYPYIQITTNVMGGDPGNEYFAGVARGDAPDLVAVSLAKFDTYVNAGIVQDITALGEWDDLANFDQGFLDSLRRDGDLYAVPNRSFPMLFGYNKALFAEAGLDGPPQTWEEVLEYAALITNADEDISGYCMLSREWTEWWFQYYVWQAGGDLTVKNADGTIELTFTDPAVITAAEFYQTLLKDGLVQSDLSLDFGSLVSRFAAGKCGMMPFASDWVNWAVGEGIRREDIGLSIFPAGPSGNQSAAISGSVWVINPAISDAKKAAAMEYIKFYTSHDYMAAFFGEMAGSGAMNPEPMVRTDLSLDEFGLPEEYAAVLAEALVTNRPEEFYGKGDFGTYVDYAIQQIIQDPTMDPAEAFAEAQALAISDGKVDDFNAQFK